MNIVGSHSFLFLLFNVEENATHIFYKHDDTDYPEIKKSVFIRR